MRALLVTAIVAMQATAFAQDGRVETPEGWYRVEEGFGETPDHEIVLIETQDSSAQAPGLQAAEPVPVPEAQPAPPDRQPSLDEEIALFQRLDCEEVRGRYVQRLLELHGVNTFGLDPRALAAWTHRRPATGGWWLAPGFGLGDPALAPLYGEPPIPPGAVSFDFTLQNLAKDLLRCASVEPAPATAPPPPAAP